jgi:hypothetical protein
MNRWYTVQATNGMYDPLIWVQAESKSEARKLVTAKGWQVSFSWRTINVQDHEPLSTDFALR